MLWWYLGDAVRFGPGLEQGRTETPVRHRNGSDSGMKVKLTSKSKFGLSGSSQSQGCGFFFSDEKFPAVPCDENRAQGHRTQHGVTCPRAAASLVRGFLESDHSPLLPVYHF